MALSDKVITWYEGQWFEGNRAVIGAADHGAWFGTLVFDGARRFEGVMPDLDRHCQRLVNSAKAMTMIPAVTAETIEGLIRDGVKRFSVDEALYLRPMMWSREGTDGVISLDPESTAFALCIEALPMPDVKGQSLTVSPFRRPRQDMALTEAKAACLYANNGRIMAEARSRGFSNALSLDIDDNVAETASTNAFFVRDGQVFTPVPNGSFLNGLNRQRVIQLLRSDGVDVIETALTVEDFYKAEEIFVTGNIAKVMPVIRFEDRELDVGPVTQRAKALYWDFAHSTT